MFEETVEIIFEVLLYSFLQNGMYVTLIIIMLRMQNRWSVGGDGGEGGKEERGEGGGGGGGGMGERG